MEGLRTMKKILFFVLFFIFMISLDSVFALNLDINIPNKYQNVVAGERIYFEIAIDYPENTQRTNMRMEYLIMDKNNDIISQSKLLKDVVSHTSFMDFIVIPTNAKAGDYLIIINARDSESLKETVGASFGVSSINSSKIKMLFFILLGAIFLIICLILAVLVLNKGI